MIPGHAVSSTNSVFTESTRIGASCCAAPLFRCSAPPPSLRVAQRALARHCLMLTRPTRDELFTVADGCWAPRFPIVGVAAPAPAAPDLDLAVKRLAPAPAKEQS